MKTFREMFKEARLKKSLQQKDVAELLEVVPAYISRLEKGFSLPSNDLILKICDHLELNVEQVYLQVILEKTDNEDIRRLIEGLLHSAENAPLSPEARVFAEGYGKLPDHQKKVVNSLLDSFSKAQH